MSDSENLEDEYLNTFVDSVKKTGRVWGLSSEKDGWAYCTSDRGEDVILFWSDEALAREHQKDEWQEHEAVSMDMDTFIDQWLQGMDGDGVLAGPNWDVDLVGHELTAKELADELLEEDEEE